MLTPLNTTTVVLVLTTTVIATSANMTIAGPKREKSNVTARSDYGNGKLTAPVRKAQYGMQVRLQGGLWYYCEVSCIDTLRREVLDFWETLSEESGDGDFD